MYGSGIRDLKIVQRSGRSNVNADALSRSTLPHTPQEGIGETDNQICAIDSQTTSTLDMSTLLESDATLSDGTPSFLEEQKKDPWLKKLIQYVQEGTLPEEDAAACKIILQNSLFTVYNNMLQFVGDKKTPLRVAVPTHLVATIVNQCHRSPSGGHSPANGGGREGTVYSVVVDETT